MAALIENSIPDFTPVSKRFYHAITRGFIADQLLQRVDPAHRHMGLFVKQEIADPLGVDVYYGLPRSLEHKVARLELYPKLTVLNMTVPLLLGLSKSRIQTFMQHFSRNPHLSGRINKVFAPWEDIQAQKDMYNQRRHYGVINPSVNCITRASDYAHVFAIIANGGSSNNTKLLSSEGLKQALKTTPELLDGFMGITTTMTNCGWGENILEFSEKGWFGWVGYGGSVTQFNVAHNISFVYTMNGMSPFFLNDIRTERLIHALEKCLFK